MRGPPNKVQRTLNRSDCLERILRNRFVNLMVYILNFSIPALLKMFVFDQMEVWEYLIFFFILQCIWISFKSNKDFITPLVKEAIDKYVGKNS